VLVLFSISRALSGHSCWAKVSGVVFGRHSAWFLTGLGGHKCERVVVVGRSLFTSRGRRYPLIAHQSIGTKTFGITGDTLSDRGLGKTRYVETCSIACSKEEGHNDSRCQPRNRRGFYRRQYRARCTRCSIFKQDMIWALEGMDGLCVGYMCKSQKGSDGGVGFLTVYCTGGCWMD